MPEQKWVSAIQDDVNPRQPVCASVLAYPLGGLDHCFVSHDRGLMLPGLVNVLIVVAVIAGEITAATHPDDVLACAGRHELSSHRRMKDRFVYGWLTCQAIEYLPHDVLNFTVPVACLPGQFSQREASKIMNGMRGQSTSRCLVHCVPLPR